jgi:hypothetical protein
MITQKMVDGVVVCNDGWFAEVETCEGTEEGFVLDIVRLDVEETQDTSQEFKMRFPVGTRLQIRTTTEITVTKHSSGKWVWP